MRMAYSLPEPLVHPGDEFVPQVAGEVQVDVGKQAGVLGDEPLQGEAPPQRVDVADANKISHQQGHRGAAAPARGSFLQGRFRVGKPPLLHYALGQQHNFPVQQQEPGQAVQADQLELLLQPLFHFPGHRPVAALGPFPAQPLQVAVRGVAGGHVGFGQGVAQVRAEVETGIRWRYGGYWPPPPAIPRKAAPSAQDDFRQRCRLGWMKGRAWSMVVLCFAATRACCKRYRSGS